MIRRTKMSRLNSHLNLYRSIVKRKSINKLFEYMEALSQFIADAVQELIPDMVMSTCNYPYIFKT